MRRPRTFQHDDGPKAKARSSWLWFHQNTVKLLERPSPHLNIHEPLWGDLKARQSKNLKKNGLMKNLVPDDLNLFWMQEEENKEVVDV